MGGGEGEEEEGQEEEEFVSVETGPLKRRLI